MRRLVLLLALAALAAAVPTAATAGGGGGFFIIETTGGGSGGHAVNSRLKVTGSVTVEFRGDEAAGCAAAHLCGVTGTVRWNPAGPGSVLAFGYREHGKRFEQGYLTFGDPSGEGEPIRTSARVRRTGVPGSLCADGAIRDAETGGAPRRGSSIEFRLLDLPGAAPAPSEVLRTRCAGPTSSDVAALLPAHQINERALIRGHRTLDFSADKTFAAHGLAGTVHSTVVVQVLGGGRITSDSGGFPGGTRKRRRRATIVSYAVERVSGRVVTGVRGLADPDLCGPLDACGLLGSVTVSPVASSGSAFLFATASIRHTRRDLRRALGLGVGPRRGGVSRYGGASWDRDRGGITSELIRDAAPACSDAEPIAGGGGVALEYFGNRVRALYGGDQFAGTDLLRTRCPGPGSTDTSGGLASGTFPVGVFRDKRVTLHLTRGAAFSGAGYSGRTSPDVTLVLRRRRIQQYVQVEPVPADFIGTVRSLR